MRIIQLIDSLESGGAERMAVNYANSLAACLPFSGLVATRKQGELKEQIDARVSYFFLNKKGKVALKALFRLRSFVKQHKVTHVHAHSTSFFLAFLLKLSLPSLKIIRHDHYGNMEFLQERPDFVLRLTASFFSGVVVVNEALKHWNEDRLHSKNVEFLANFTLDALQNGEIITRLEGEKGKRMLLLANLRPQKNHFLVLEVANLLKPTHPDWTFHLVGKDFADDYSKAIKNRIVALHLQNQVFLYGSQSDVASILQQSTIGVLTSVSEGLPVAVLEYGMHGLPVVVTAVGALPDMIASEKTGFIVASGDAQGFYEALVRVIEDLPLRAQLAKAFQTVVQDRYAASSIVSRYLTWIATL
ncbi:glycosyltransferase [Flavobacterium sp. TSSA_36]|uniref:glycosyltransferase n=1 Tax=Flavobacterium sp. TSSA_36 TaxID=3447669 RepID=UPI003F31DE1A